MKFVLGAVFAAICVVSGTPQAPAAPAVEKIGPKLGERVPDFSLPDQQGTPRTLKSILGPDGAMLVFYRSADW